MEIFGILTTSSLAHSAGKVDTPTFNCSIVIAMILKPLPMEVRDVPMKRVTSLRSAVKLTFHAAF
jgi:hypothetical protein